MAAHPPFHSKDYSAKAGQKLTILLVDDEQILSEMMADALEQFGFRVLTASDGKEALAIYAGHSNEITLIISDCAMPNLGGWELMNKLRKTFPALPVILTSGYDGYSPENRSDGVQPDAFLLKPFPLSQLFDTIHQVLLGANSQQSRQPDSKNVPDSIGTVR
jgi:two-component system, cell cycle sensor histidine kinase and response regulator CckA